MTLTVGEKGRAWPLGSLIGVRDVQDTVDIDIEGDLDLRNTTESRRSTRPGRLSA